MRSGRIGWAAALALGLGCHSVSAQSLRDLFVAALNADPSLAASEAQYRASEERLRQARSAILPNLEVSASSGESHFDPDEGGARSREFHTSRWAVQLSQALYRPESTMGLAAARAEREATRVQLDAATDEVAVRVATAYFDLLGARELVLTLKREGDAAQLQLAAAKHGFDKGAVAVTEILDARAKRDLVCAQAGAADNDLLLKQELFKQLIGGLEFELNVLPRNAPDPLPAEESLSQLIAEALERNPISRQARLQWEASKLGVRQARRGHLPKVDLALSYGNDQSTGTPSNPTSVHGKTTQAQASLTLPLFSGFATDARIGEARAVQDKSETDLENAERTVSRNVREAYFGLKSAMGQIASLKTAEVSTETAVRAQRKGYRIGTTTTAEVLKAETLFAQTRRDLMKAKFDAQLARIKLQVALGRPWRESIHELSELLVPEHLTPDSRVALDADLGSPRAVDCSGTDEPFDFNRKNP